MFCPSCGSNEQMSQYCRACGTDLRPVRTSLERPDSITASAVSAREEIGRAVADKIREVEDSRDLKRVAEDVLPQIEKFLESYEEKRLRRVRAGVIVAASGFGTGILGLIMSLVLNGGDAESALLVVGLGAIAFAIGIGLVLNGMMFTRPRKGLEDHSSDARSQNLLDAGYAPQQLRSSAEAPPSFRSQTHVKSFSGFRIFGH
jgi:hypothetical protein